MCVSLIVLLDQLLYRHDGKGKGEGRTGVRTMFVASVKMARCAS